MADNAICECDVKNVKQANRIARNKIFNYAIRKKLVDYLHRISGLFHLIHVSERLNKKLWEI